MLLRELVSLSEALLDDARAGRWEAVAARQEARRPLVDRLSAIGSEANDRAAVEKVIRLDEMLRTLANEQRDRIASDTRESQSLRNASTCYDQVRRMNGGPRS